jgi:hypothetical protein
MSKRPIAAIAFALQCVCGSTRRCAQIPGAGLVVAVLAAACGGYPDAAHGFLFQHHTEFAADVGTFLDDE